MLARFFRLSDRLGQLIIKISIWIGGWLTLSARSLSLWVQERVAGPPPLTDSARVETQVRSLSGLTVMLLAAVAVLIFWATSAQAQASPVVRFLSIGSTPQAPADTVQSVPAAPANTTADFFQGGGTIVFSMYSGSQQDLYALAAGQTTPVRLTDDPADDRDPVWSPDGTRIAFSSRRDGNWEIYILDVTTGEVTRLTYDLAYEARPSWSNDGVWLTYEAYYQGNLDVYIVKADASEGPYPLTRQPGPDYHPAWIPDIQGREIAYVSARNGGQPDIYLLSLDNPSEDRAVDVTNTPDVAEDEPTWQPGGGVLAYSAIENGVSLVYAVPIADGQPGTPFVVGQGHSPAWSPDGKSLVFITDRPQGGSILLTGQFGTWETSVQAFSLTAQASSPSWSGVMLPAVPRGTLAFAAIAPVQPAYTETLAVEPQPGTEAPYKLVDLQALGVIAPAPYLSDRVDGSFSALRQYMDQAAGWDFLGQLDNVWWDLTRRPEPGQAFRNWHKAGRAFDIVQDYAQRSPAQIELIPEQVGPDTTWRLYVRCAIQDGSLGEPLRQVPWDFSARYTSDVDAYQNGGKPKDSIPSGYYVDFTEAAAMFGWSPVPSATSWRSNWPSILYWQYEKHDGLDWWSAMLELYPASALTDVFGPPATPAPAIGLTVTPEPGATPTPEN